MKDLYKLLLRHILVLLLFMFCLIYVIIFFRFDILIKNVIPMLLLETEDLLIVAGRTIFVVVDVASRPSFFISISSVHRNVYIFLLHVVFIALMLTLVLLL